jgi:hypothetical protein
MEGKFHVWVWILMPRVLFVLLLDLLLGGYLARILHVERCRIEVKGIIPAIAVMEERVKVEVLEYIVRVHGVGEVESAEIHTLRNNS